MVLADLWLKSPELFSGKLVHQVIGFAGVGRLTDGTSTSSEFREFLKIVPSGMIARYARECLASKFEGKGFALQDIVNEVGNRLGHAVSPGVYQGDHGKANYDGLWRSPEGRAIIVEVKSSDTYPVDIKKLAGYRRILLDSEDILEDRSSILIVIGKEDTRDLEAQIRGSKSAWDVRLISVDGLLALMELKENTEEPATHQKIRDVLLPREFTKLDGLIDLVFATSKDFQQEQTHEEEGSPEAADEMGRRPRVAAVGFHEACIARVQPRVNQPLVRRSRTLFASPDNNLRVVCAVSKEHDPGTTPNYWFAFHPHNLTSLKESSVGFVALGCGSARAILMIPFDTFITWLDGLWTTQRSPESYWHVLIYWEDGRFVLHRKKGYDRIDLTKFLLQD